MSRNTLHRVVRAVAGWLRRLVIALLLLSFVLVIAASLGIYAISSVLTDRDVYHNLIQQAQLAERAPATTADYLVLYSLQASHMESPYLTGLPSQTWATVADLLVTEQWLEENLHNLVDACFDWLADPQAALPSFTLDLSPLIQTLNSPRGALAVLPLLQNTPTCHPDVTEISIMGQELISCLPPEGNLTALAQRIATTMAAGLPQEISFNSLYQSDIIQTETLQVMAQVRLVPHLLRAALTLGLRLSFLLFLLYGLFYTTSPRQFLGAQPLPFYLAGAFSLIMLGGLHIFFQFGLSPALDLFLPPERLELSVLLADAMRTLAAAAGRLWLYGSVCLLAGGLLLQLMIWGLNKYTGQHARLSDELPRPGRRLRRQFR
jgi:hypothetical protein